MLMSALLTVAPLAEGPGAVWDPQPPLGLTLLFLWAVRFMDSDGINCMLQTDTFLTLLCYYKGLQNECII